MLDARGQRELDARRLGQGAPRDRAAGRGGAGQRGRSRQRDACPRNRRSRSPMCSCAKPIPLHDLFADTVKQYQRSLDITQNQYNAGTAAKSDVITAQAQVLAAQAQEINTGVARAQNEHAIAVLMGRPPSELTISHAQAGRGRSRDPRSRCPRRCWSAGPTSPPPSGRWRSRTPPSASRSPAITPTSRFRAPSATTAIRSSNRSPAPIRCGLMRSRSRSRCSTAA